MPEIIISDTSCLIILKKINQLEILTKLYSKVWVTPEVLQEFGEELVGIEVRRASDNNLIQVFSRMVDLGEASALALAIETKNSLLILDDKKARKLAETLGLATTGTLGVLLKAKRSGYIQSMRDVLTSLNTTDFRISDKIVKEILKEAGEI
jgi:predicted nucleic acid-binding protein